MATEERSRDEEAAKMKEHQEEERVMADPSKECVTRRLLG